MSLELLIAIFPLVLSFVKFWKVTSDKKTHDFQTL